MSSVDLVSFQHQSAAIFVAMAVSNKNKNKNKNKINQWHTYSFVVCATDIQLT